MSSRNTLLPTLGLLTMTAVWGSTFVLIKDVVARMPVADFLAVRFAVAALAMLALFPRHVWRLGRAGLARGLALGAIYGCGQLLQTWGLALISPSVSGFATGMYVVFTPILATALFRQRMPSVVWIAVALATAGLALLSLNGLSVDAGVWLRWPRRRSTPCTSCCWGSGRVRARRSACRRCRWSPSRWSACSPRCRTADPCSRRTAPHGWPCSTWR